MPRSAKKKRQREIDVCSNKQKLSKGQAKRIVIQMKGDGKYVKSYKCSVCGKWHLSHRSREMRAYDRATNPNNIV